MSCVFVFLRREKERNVERKEKKKIKEKD